MLHTLIDPHFILVFGFLVFFAHQAFTYGRSNNWGLAICYGIVAVLALFATAVILLGAH